VDEEERDAHARARVHAPPALACVTLRGKNGTAERTALEGRGGACDEAPVLLTVDGPEHG
jgi:hypothetical protein